jgi:hypothetical protein
MVLMAMGAEETVGRWESSTEVAPGRWMLLLWMSLPMDGRMEEEGVVPS